MHAPHLDGMLKALAPVLKNQNKARMILDRYWTNRIAIVWTVEQVHRAANELRTALTNACQKHSWKASERHNAQYGLNWECLINAIEDSGKGRNLTKVELKRFIEYDVITTQTASK